MIHVFKKRYPDARIAVRDESAEIVMAFSSAGEAGEQAGPAGSSAGR